MSEPKAKAKRCMQKVKDDWLKQEEFAIYT